MLFRLPVSNTSCSTAPSIFSGAAIVGTNVSSEPKILFHASLKAILGIPFKSKGSKTPMID
ncbi:hypothetical protein D3C76_447650 [compost metagenome]